MRKLITSAVLVLAGAALSGCSWNNANQQYQDANRDGNNSGPAETGSMPDGFSNYATKCDHGNRVYVIYHGNKLGTGAIAVVPQDPSCKK